MVLLAAQLKPPTSFHSRRTWTRGWCGWPYALHQWRYGFPSC